MAFSDLSSKSGDIHHLSEVSIVLLGCQNSGKSSAGYKILGQNELQKSTKCVMRHGEVAGRKINVVEAPGWCSDTPEEDSTGLLKEEITLSVSMCPPGPHAVLLVVNGDKIFTEKDREILAGYLNLLGDKVWSHTIILFTFGDSLGDTSIERHIEREGEALQWLVKKCGSRCHVLKNKMDDESQVMELLEKIEKMVEGNRSCHLDSEILPKAEDSRSKEEEKSKERRMHGMKCSPSFLNICIYFFKFLQVFWFSSELELLPVQSIIYLPRFRVGFHRVLQFLPFSQKRAEIFREHSGTETGSQSTSTLHPDAGNSSADTEIFTPELVKKCPEDKNRDEFRFLCPRAGQFKCKVTDLVFEMDGKGEVLYRIVPWDNHVLKGMNQNEPAGPLYSIECSEGSISYLHLPHCETRTDVVELTVAHVTGENVELIQPLNVTETHAIIKIHGLSCFGFLKALFFQAYPIRAQVILFYKIMTGKHRMRKLHIHLLPGNVPVEEVQKQHECKMYIETSSKCQLTPGKTYKPRCKTTNCDYVLQPEDETFDCNYGPNYHPTFEVAFRTEIDEVTLSLLDETGHKVWRPRQVWLTGTEEASTKMDSQTRAGFVDKHRGRLIQSVASVMEIADCLLGREMITTEMYGKIEAETTTPQGQMRELLKNITDRATKEEFYRILRDKQPYLVKELESGSGQA